ncbi:tRNA pseudouridine(55) synthase TruB [Lactococcus termiticola]|uniref:tRNA pseudouridine synthase B n=1 Tax=Lactococcus termiticola TaxID=2169526 RepID=A0A2R5HI19_9LACT|nr:tRNA pseudouridine(55) synthase TruB [Lactococcus termiticola]GBG97105.1 tRNA pseudouridine synthase B [Lactococcus termiticola]
MNGILNVYKEAGWTSFDVVAKLRGILKTKKIGHGGTLDPAVTGVLPVAVGSATRLLEYMESAGKVYEGTVTLGFSTETEDAEGAVVEETALKAPIPVDAIDQAMQAFIGEIQQVPPMYSAVKVKGKRLYEYARAGEAVERPVRTIRISAFERTSNPVFDEEKQTLSFDFRVACSKGTYVRTLAVDLAKRLGYAGHMSRLVRTSSNGLDISEAKSLDDIAQAMAEGQIEQILQPLEVAVSDLPGFEVAPEQAIAIRQGKKFASSDFPEFQDRLAMFYEGKLLAVYMHHPEQADTIKPHKVIQ